MTSNCFVCKKAIEPESATKMSCVYCHERQYCSRTCFKHDWQKGHSLVCKSNHEHKLLLLEQKCPFIKEGIVLTAIELQRLDECMMDPMHDSKKRILDAYEKVHSSLKNSSKDSGIELFLVRHKTTHKPFTLKTIKKRLDSKRMPLAQTALNREIEVQRRLLHKNILRLYDYSSDEQNVYVVLEYAKKGTMFHYIQNKGTLEEHEAFLFFTQVCSAVQFLHKNNFVHRDLKPESLMLTADGTVKISDFSCCAYYESGSDEM